MTRSPGWFIAWVTVICLLWIRDLPLSVSPHVGVSVGSWSHVVRVFLSMSPSFFRTPAEALDSSACHHRACVTAGNGSPPWRDRLAARSHTAAGRPTVDVRIRGLRDDAHS
jgi:hypothetical protein